MEYRIFISMAEQPPEGAEANAEELRDAFARTYPAAGAVVGARPDAGVFDVTYSVDGTHVQDAFRRAWGMFGDVVLATRLPAGIPILRFELEVVTADDLQFAGP